MGKLADLKARHTLYNVIVFILSIVLVGVLGSKDDSEEYYYTIAATAASAGWCVVHCGLTWGYLSTDEKRTIYHIVLSVGYEIVSLLFGYALLVESKLNVFDSLGKPLLICYTMNVLMYVFNVDTFQHSSILGAITAFATMYPFVLHQLLRTDGWLGIQELSGHLKAVMWMPIVAFVCLFILTGARHALGDNKTKHVHYIGFCIAILGLVMFVLGSTVPIETVNALYNVSGDAPVYPRNALTLIVAFNDCIGVAFAVWGAYTMHEGETIMFTQFGTLTTDGNQAVAAHSSDLTVASNVSVGLVSGTVNASSNTRYNMAVGPQL